MNSVNLSVLLGSHHSTQHLQVDTVSWISIFCYGPEVFNLNSKGYKPYS